MACPPPPDSAHGISLHQCWAKTDPATDLPALTVRDHCLIVGAVAEAMGLPPFFAWLAACHDVGKVSPGFQMKCPTWLKLHGLTEVVKTRAWKNAESDHSKVSQFSLQHYLKNHHSLGKDAAARWASLSAMHHGSPHWRGNWNEHPSGIDPNDAWEGLRHNLIRELAIFFNMTQPLPPAELENITEPSQFCLAGSISVADWIGSDETFFPLPGMDADMEGDTVRRAARAAIMRIGFAPANFTTGKTFEELFGFPPNELQRQAIATITGPGVYVVEAPMGMGKTEAALAVAYQLISRRQATGIYFALPTQATSNRIHQRTMDFLSHCEEVAPRLIHSGSWLMDHEMSVPMQKGYGSDLSAARDWFSSSKRALLAPLGVGTIDQALMSIIAVRHFFVRHFALAGKVVILDEIHSYDAYTGTLTTALIASLRQLGCSVIILSATLTRDRRQQLLSLSNEKTGEEDPFPLITGVPSTGLTQTHRVEPPPARPPVAIRFRPEKEAMEAALKAAEAGACVLWICNTVDHAIITRDNLTG